MLRKVVFKGNASFIYIYISYMFDFHISSGRLNVDAATYRKALPPCCFLLIVSSVMISHEMHYSF